MVMIIMIITSDSRADDLSPQRHIGSEKRSRLHRGSITIAPGDYFDGDDYQDDFLKIVIIMTIIITIAPEDYDDYFHLSIY